MSRLAPLQNYLAYLGNVTMQEFIASVGAMNFGMNGQEQLIALLAIPSLCALGVIVLGRWPNVREAVTILSSLALLVVAWPLALGTLAGVEPRWFMAEPLAGVRLELNTEPLGAVFVLVASTLWVVSSLYSIGYMRGNKEKHQTRFYACFAIAIASTMGVATAGNLFTMFVFYELLTLSTYPLVAHHGDDAARRGGRTYLTLLLGTSIGFLLLAIMWTYSLAGHVDFRAGGILTGHISGWEISALLGLFAYGIGKAALMPFHRWLPAAMVAPTPVSALLHAVAVVKAGVFCVTKVVVYVFGLELLRGETSTVWLVWVAGFSIIAASVVALRQDNLKRRLAYSTVSQLGYVVLAAALVAPLSLMAAVLHIAAHAFSKITLFFAAGSIYTAAHKTKVSELAGIGRRMPWTMGAFAVATLSMIGLPPTAGFVSKWYLLGGAWEAQSTFALVVLTVSTLLNAAYFLPILYTAFFREAPDDGDHPHGEAPVLMVVALVFTAAVTVAIFFVPDIPVALAQAMLAR
jgi:multicomponent Na+:H+ antiporter subunit D